MLGEKLLTQQIDDASSIIIIVCSNFGLVSTRYERNSEMNIFVISKKNE